MENEEPPGRQRQEPWQTLDRKPLQRAEPQPNQGTSSNPDQRPLTMSAEKSFKIAKDQCLASASPSSPF